MSYYTIFSTFFRCQNMNRPKNPRTASYSGAIRGLFYSFKAQPLSRCHPSRNTPDGHRCIRQLYRPQRAIAFRRIRWAVRGLGQFKEHTADSDRLRLHPVAPCHLPLGGRLSVSLIIIQIGRENKSDIVAYAIVILKPYGFSDILFAIKLA